MGRSLKRGLREAGFTDDPERINHDTASDRPITLDLELEGQELMFHLSQGPDTLPSNYRYVRTRDRGITNMAFHLNKYQEFPTVLTGRAAKRARRKAKVTLRNANAAAAEQYDIKSDLDLDNRIYKRAVFLAIQHRFIDVPTTYRQAMKSPQRAEWITAMDSERNSLIANATCELVPKPPRRRALDTRWVFSIKYLSSGEIESFKARLVVKRFLHTHGIDFFETFAPVVRVEVLRLILTIAAALDWEIHQMDVKTAFLDLGEAEYPIGWHLSCDRSNRLIFKVRR